MAVNYIINVISSAACSAILAGRGASVALTTAESTELAADLDTFIAAAHANTTISGLESGAAGSPQTQALRAAVTAAMTGCDCHTIINNSTKLTALITQIVAIYTINLAHMGSLT